MNKQDFFQQITNKIITKISSGEVGSWEKMWNGSLPKNGTTDKEYTGINSLWLSLQGFDDPRFATFNQIRKAGGTVLKGSKGTKIFFYKPVFKKNIETGKDEFAYCCPKFFTVFNYEQTKGLPALETNKDQTDISNLIELLFGYCANQNINLVCNARNASYSPKWDRIMIPSLQSFKTNCAYLSTLAHEVAHSTGAKNRLDRPGVTNFDHFGSHQYSKEELIAELTSVFYLKSNNINETFDNNIAYMKGWLRPLKDDPSMIFEAMKEAKKAFSYIKENEQTLFEDGFINKEEIKIGA